MRRRGVYALLAGVLLCMAVFGVAAQTDDAARPTSMPVSEQTLRDPEFGVITRQFGLRRTVQMYQWQRQRRGYAKVWSQDWIDSSRHSAGHANPGAPSLDSREWLSDDATLDGRPLAAETLLALGQWHVFRPGFTALSERQAAVFQPEGDGLGSALNPMAPAVGDLRIHWEELRLPALDDRVQLRNGHWAPTLRSPGEAASPVSAPDRSASHVALAALPDWLRTYWWAVLASLVVLLLVLGRLRG